MRVATMIARMTIALMAAPAAAAVIDFEAQPLGSDPGFLGDPLPFLYLDGGSIGGDADNHYLFFTFADADTPKVARFILLARETAPDVHSRRYLQVPHIESFDIFAPASGAMIRQTNGRLLASIAAGASTIFPDDLQSLGRGHFDLVFPSSTAGDLRIDNVVYSISYNYVPEPASWAMMLTGFGLVGGMMRRRPFRSAIAA